MDLRPVAFTVPKKIIIGPVEWKEQYLPRLEYAASLQIPHLQSLPPHGGTCIVVGAGPSVLGQLDQIKELRTDFSFTCSINGAHDWLVKNGVVPNIHVIFEFDSTTLEELLGGPPNDQTVYYVCSHCRQDVIKGVEGYKRALWHADQDDEQYQAAITGLFPNEFMVGGNHITFFRTLSIAMCLGFRKFELFGVDASFVGDFTHMEGYKLSNLEEVYHIWGCNEATNELRKFKTTANLALLAYDFFKFCEAYQSMIMIRVHGDSLLRYVHESKYPNQYLE